MAENISVQISIQDLADAGVQFGHLKSKWDPRMAQYIYMEKNGIHLIDINKTARKMEEAGAAIKNIAKSGRKILFVATKKQAKEIIKEGALKVNMPFVTERWLGGMLTNFPTVLKSIKRMTIIDKMMADGTINTFAKKERLMISRERAKLESVLGGIAKEKRIPAAIFVVDLKKEHIAIAEAEKLNLTSFGIVDTNANPNDVMFPIPANDDATKSIQIIMDYVVKCIQEGIAERKISKEGYEEDKMSGTDMVNREANAEPATHVENQELNETVVATEEAPTAESHPEVEVENSEEAKSEE